MRYVKSCKSKDNPLRCGTIKIGSLHEYRDIEEEQIADRQEGFIELVLKLDDIHLKLDEFQEFLNSHNSYASFETIGHINTGGPSDAVPGLHHFPRFHAKSNLNRNNLFVFCLSAVENHEEVKISTEYDDCWHFEKDDIQEMALGLIKGLFSSIWSNRRVIFPKHNLSESFEIEACWEQITYTPRKIVVNNYIYHTNRLKYLEMVRRPQFIKPIDFSSEKEFRICFDIYDNGVMLHPAVKHIIISAENIKHLIRQ